MRKIFVLAIVVLLSLSLVWAAETIKSTNQPTAKGKLVTQAPDEDQARTAPQTPKAPRPAKTVENPTVIDLDGSNQPAETPKQMSAPKPSPEAEPFEGPTTNESKYLGLGYDKIAAEKEAGMNSPTILQFLQEQAVEAPIAPEIQAAPYVEEPQWQPQYGEKGELLNAQPVLYLNGQQNTDEPITQGIITSTLLFQSFGAPVGWNLTTPPAGGWAVLDSGSEGTQYWTWDKWHKFYYVASGWADTVAASNYACATYPDSVIETWMITPAFDLSAATTCSLYFKQYYLPQTGTGALNDSAKVLISVDNGATWNFATPVLTQTVATANPARTFIDLIPFADTVNHHTAVKLAFRHFIKFVGTSPVSTNGWVTDSITVKANGSNLWVQDFSNQMSGWYGDTPPAGPGGAWTILNNCIAPVKFNSNGGGNDWSYRFSSPGNLGNDTVAANTRNGGCHAEWENDWLISPMFAIGASVACTLSFNESWQIDNFGNYFPPNTSVFQEHGYVRIQETTDGGTTWGPWSIVVDNSNVFVGGSNVSTVVKFPLNDWRSKTVRLAWQKVGPPELNFGTWYVKDVWIQDYTPVLDNVGTASITSPIIAGPGRNWAVKPKVYNNGQNTETFNDSTKITTYVPGSTIMSTGFENGGLRPAGWTDSPGTFPWLYDGGLSHGPGSVHGGSYAAYFNIYSYSSGTTDSLISPSMDLSSLGGLYGVEYWSWHLSGTDSVRVYLDESGVKTYLQTMPNSTIWSKNVAYFSSTSTAAKIYFIGYSRFGSYNLYIDDVAVYPVSLSTVYLSSETVTSMPALSTQVLTYASTWDNPASGTYSVTSWTSLVDSVAGDNSRTATVVSYDHTGSGGPDAGSYTFKDNITGGGPAYSWIDISSLGAPISFDFGTGNGRYTRGLGLGFSFWYYGINKSRIFVAEDGYVSFDSMTTFYNTNAAIPSTAAPNNLLALFWDDLSQTPGGQARFYTNNVDTAIVSLTNWGIYASMDTTLRFDAQMILSKNDARIKFQYRKFEPGLTLSHTIGIENSGGTAGLQYVYNGSPMGNLPIPPLAITFYAPADEIVASSIVSPAGSYMATGRTYSVKGRFKNNGASAQTFDARMVINDGVSDVKDSTVTGLSLNPGDSVTVTFYNYSPASAGTNTFTMTAINPGDDVPSNNTLIAVKTVYLHEGSGGPDGANYSWKDNTVIGGPVFSWVDMSAAVPCTLTSYDDWFKRIAMGAPFYFYGANFDSLTIGTNGYLTFDWISASPTYNANIPDVGVPNNLIDWMRRDMNTRLGGISYLNDVVNNRFVVQYDSTVMYGTAYYQDVQLILNRADSSVTIQYDNLSGNGYTNFTIGTENGAGTVGLAYYYSATLAAGLGNYPYSGLAIRFYYTAPAADVGITNITLPPAGFVSVGTPYTFAATAQNFTANSATFNVEFYVDAVLLGTATSVTLLGDSSATVTCPNTWTPATSGSHTLMAKTVYAPDNTPANNQYSTTRTALGATVTVPYSTDFEANNGGFVGLSEWEWGIPTYASGPPAAHSPVNLWGTDLDNTYDASTLNTLYSVPMDLTGGVAPTVKFWMWYAFETNYDGANINISTDNGSTWTVITTSLPYNGTGYSSAPGIAGEPVWTGSLGWTQVMINLTPYAGQTVILKYDQSADGSVQYAGLYIDDFSLYEPPAIDLSVTAIVAPVGPTIQGFTFAVQSRVHNFGSVTQASVPVHFEIYDTTSALVYDHTYTLTQIEPGIDSIVSFPGWAPGEQFTHSLVSYTAQPAEMIPANDTSRSTTYTYSHRGSGGPVENWTYADNVNGGGPAFSWVDITTLGTPVIFGDPDDGNSGYLPMGFNFKFFGTNYSQVNVNVNGWQSFTDASSGAYSNVSIPSTALPNALVATLWDDLHKGTGTIYQYYDAVNNQFTIEYYQIEYYSSGGPDQITFEVIFNGNNNSIKMQYLSFVGGSQTDVTVGIENQAGTVGLAYDNNGEIGQTPLPGVAVTWTYTPPDVDVAFDRIGGQIGVAGSLPVCALFANTGNDAGNVTAHFEVRDGSNNLVFSGNGSGSVPGNGSATICASTNWAATTGAYTINVTANIPDDTDPNNNNGSGTFHVVPSSVQIPYADNFESGFPPSGWTILHYGDDGTPAGTWQESHLAYRSPTTSAFQDDDPSSAYKDEWLVMQPLDFTTAYLPNWKYYEDGAYFPNYGIAHEFWVGTGTVFDINNAILVAQHTPLNHVMGNFGGGPGDQFGLSAYNGNANVWLAFRYIGQYSDEWYVDDVSVTDNDRYDAAVISVTPSATIVQPGATVGMQVQLHNNGYLPLVASLTTIGIGTVSGEVYNNVTTGINIDGFGDVDVTLPDFNTTPACGESYSFTSTVSAPGDTVATNNIGTAYVATGYLFEANSIDDWIYYYWTQHWYFLRKLGKPSQGVISQAAIFYQDIAVPRYTFDFLIFGDSSNGGPNRDTLYSITVQNAYPNKTLIDISPSLYASLPDSFFFAVNNKNGNGTYYTGPLSDNGLHGGVGSYRARNDSLNWLAFPYIMGFSEIVDVRGNNFLDLTPLAIDAPGSVIIGAGPFAVTGTVKNVGTADVTGGSAHMVITGSGGTDFDVTISPIDLTAGASTSVNFGNWAPSLGGDTYALTMTVSVANEGDVCNNTITSTSLAITGARAVFDDFENNNGGFTGTSVWQYGVPTYSLGPAAYSGANVWGTVLADVYPINACDSLRTPVYAAPATGGAMVVYVWYDNEQDWDGMNVKVSEDGGPYALVTPVGGYPFVEGGYLCNLMVGQGYYSGTSGGWFPIALDLTLFAGHNISFSFDFGSDGSVVFAGTYLDDFTIYDYYPESNIGVSVTDMSIAQVEDTSMTYTDAFSISNTGLANLTYTASTSLPWITLVGGLRSDIVGDIPPGGSDTIDVVINTTGITPGTYTDSVTINTNDPDTPVLYRPLITIEVQQGGCPYVIGDINGSGGANGIDVNFGVNYFKGGPNPPITCDMCPQPAPFYAAGDVNGNCAFNGIDITFYVNYLKGLQPALLFCPTCPPAGLAIPAVIVPTPKAKVNEAGSND